MIKKADELRAEDEKNFQRVEAKNKLESMVYSYRNQLDSEQFSKLPQVEDLKTFIKSQQDWIDANREATAEELNAKSEEIEKYFKEQMAGMSPGGMAGMGGMEGMAGMGGMEGMAGMSPEQMEQMAKMYSNMQQDQSQDQTQDQSPSVDEVD